MLIKIFSIWSLEFGKGSQLNILQKNIKAQIQSFMVLILFTECQINGDGWKKGIILHQAKSLKLTIRESSLRKKQNFLFFVEGYCENQDHLDNVSYFLKQ